MKITEEKLRKIIKEEIQAALSESGVLWNIYGWCPAGSKCPPKKQKTNWWKRN